MEGNVFSNKTRDLSGSAIRATFKLLADPEIISFAGGAPSPDVFPKKELEAIAQDIFATRGNLALQYGITEGYTPLRDFVKDRLVKQGVIKESEQVIITTGGQQVIDLCAKVLLNEGDNVVVEAPSFVGGLNCFRSYNANMIPVDVLSDGMDLDYLEEEVLKKVKVKLVYTIATFQNPSGITMSTEKRKRLLNLADKYDFFILEDNPYGELRYRGEAVPTIKSMDSENRVIYAGSFSKTLSPGLRIGFFSAREDILEKMVVCKQVTDVHTPVLNQLIAYDFVTKHDYDAHIKKSCDLYGKKNQLMLSCMDEMFPKYCDYTRPEGGLFLWCNLPETFDSSLLFKKGVEKKVAFVPGSSCMVDQAKKYSSFRLNFSNTSDENIHRGIGILSDVIKSFE
ncbi:MAG: PLP-dependent aminotransferase family protein [Clostridia bacterium]|nr:PLP-dependent aminotransferase family protein [Clostridia bacterium]